MAHDTGGVVEYPVVRLERVPGKVRTLSLGLLVLGVVAFAAALMTDATRAWRAYLFNWLFFTSVAQGAVLLAAAVTITRGIWSRSIRRIAISFVAFLPLAFVLMFPIIFAADHIFPWVGEDLVGNKEAWLNVPFLAARNVVGFGALVALSLLFAYWSLRPDAGRFVNDMPGKLRGLYERLSRGWRGQEEEEERAIGKLRRLAPALALVYAVVMSFIAFDFIMSLEPHWFSTLFGPYFFMPAFLGGIAATVVATLLYRRSLGLEEYILPSQLHDIGKLTFAFSIFWAYLFWAQFIVIWYGLLPHEQDYVIHRFKEPFTGFSLFVFFTMFVIPFAGLLGAKPKKTPITLGLFASVILVGLWVERYILVYPSYYHGAEEALFGWPEIGIGLAFAGLLLASLSYFATRFPIIQVWEPHSEEEILGSTAEPPAEVATGE